MDKKPMTWLCLCAILLLSIVDNSTVLFSPLLLGTLIDNWELTGKEAGYIASTEATFGAIFLILSGYLIKKYSLCKLSAIGIILLVIANAVTALLSESTYLLIVRMFAGAGKGLLAATIISAIVRTLSAEKSFAFIFLGTQIFSVIAYPLVGIVIENYAMYGAYMLMAFISIFGFCSLPFISKNELNTTTDDKKTAINPSLNSHLIIPALSTLLFFLAIGSVWPFLERIGSAQGISAIVMGNIMGVSSFLGILGTAAAFLIANRLGRHIPLAVGPLSILVGLLLIVIHQSSITFMLCAGSFMFGWFFTLPYLMGSIAMLDSKGSMSSICGGVQSIGFAVGPFISGLTVINDDYTYTAILGLIFTVISIIFMQVLATIANHPQNNTIIQFEKKEA